MARPREFDERDALAAAAGVFQRQGYAATSVDDLVRATGVHRASLYGAFGSKYGLFLRVIDEAEMAPEAALDLFLVALTELAPTDQPLRARIAAELARHSITVSDLGRRVLTRAGLPTHSEKGTMS